MRIFPFQILLKLRYIYCRWKQCTFQNGQRLCALNLEKIEDKWCRKDINLLLFFREGYKGPYGPIDRGNIAVCSRNQICSGTLSPERVVATVKLFIMFLEKWWLNIPVCALNGFWDFHSTLDEQQLRFLSCQTSGELHNPTINQCNTTPCLPDQENLCKRIK